MFNPQVKEKPRNELKTEEEVKAWVKNLPNLKDEFGETASNVIVKLINNAQNRSQYQLAAKALDGLLALHEDKSRELYLPGQFYFLRSYVNVKLGTDNYIKAAEDLEKAKSFAKETRLKLGGRMSDEEFLKEHYQNYELVNGIVGGIPTNEKLESMRKLASKVTLSSFTQEVLNYNKKETETVDRASIEIRYVMATLKDRFDKEKPQSPKEQLNLIHDHVHKHFGYRYAPLKNVLENINTHSLDCDAASLLFVEAGKQLGLPIQFRSALVPAEDKFSVRTAYNGKGLHGFVAYANKDGTDAVTWETLQEKLELREYKNDSTFVKDRVLFNDKDFLSIQYVSTKENDSALYEYEAIKFISSVPMDEDNPLLLKRNEIYSKVLEISPNNIDALFKIGKKEEALEVAKKLGGEVLKEWFQRIIENTGQKTGGKGIELVIPKADVD